MNARPYQMENRAAAAAETATRILDAAMTRYARMPYDRVRLEDVAADAAVTPQTVIRRFGGKPGLIVAVAERGMARITQARAARMGVDPADTIHDLVDHYEEYGALILKVYAEAGQIAGMPDLAAAGRRYHVDWCRQVFEPHLPTGLDAATRGRRLAQIVAVCDATVWRILREDAGLPPEQIERALGELLLPLLEAR